MLTPIETPPSTLHGDWGVTLTFGIGGVRGGENEGELQAKFGGRFYLGTYLAREREFFFGRSVIEPT